MAQLTLRQKARAAVDAAKAKRYGARYSYRIAIEARRAGIPVSLGFALIEQESNFRNVFGHDPTIFIGAGNVTKQKYLAYKRQRGHSHMQGVGPAQLTWWEFQDVADKYGGCWNPTYNIRVAFEHLATLVRSRGNRDGIKAYNGTGPAADRYASQVLAKMEKWRKRLS